MDLLELATSAAAATSTTPTRRIAPRIYGTTLAAS
jgi:hypothetical protein